MPDKKQTALQELIEVMENVWPSMENSYTFKKAKQLLLKEKQQIKSAFDAGQNTEFCKPENYFNETYITQDK